MKITARAMPEETVAAGWDAYAKDIKPTEAERERLRETFYSGAFAGHVLTLAALFGEVAVQNKRIDALQEELQPKDRS